MGHVDPLLRSDLPQFEEYFRRRDAAGALVFNSMLTMGRRPEILDSFRVFVASIYDEGVVDQQLKALVALMRSATAGCRYCQAHTASRAGGLDVDAEKLAAIWDFEDSPLFTAAERAALRLARDAALVPNATTDQHFVSLREHFSDDQIVEIVAVISLFAFLNSFNDTLATQLEEGPGRFAASALGHIGWTAGKHAE